MGDQFDLVVVGGGLAGASLAKSLAERGARVLVLERDEQFRDRVRGEMMTPWGVAEAESLGVGELLRSGCAHELPWVDFFSGSTLTVHRPVAATTPQQLPCLAFYHPAMQEVLLQGAANAGAEVRRGATVQEVRPGSPPSVIAQSDGRTEEVHARMIVGADGRSSLVCKTARFPVMRDPDRLLVAGVLMENLSVPEDTAKIVIDSNQGRVAAIFPQGKGRVRGYFCYYKDARSRIQGDSAFADFVESCKRTGADPGWYAGAKAAGPLASFEGADTKVKHPYRDGVALIGDAAATSDPSWGQGLSMTVRDARVLRDKLLAHEDWDAAGHAYAEEHDRYCEAVHSVVGWYTELFLGQGPEADARRVRAMPLIGEDPTRQPDLLFSGPDMPVDEHTRQRFFGEN
jgi:2-polyprenyl-6-methoxyphenol hydroxylase-like FAD-dependent oxidoreductase